MRVFLATLYDTAQESLRGYSIYLLLGFCALVALVIGFGITNVRQGKPIVEVPTESGTGNVLLGAPTVKYEYFGKTSELDGTRRQALRTQILNKLFLKWIFSFSEQIFFSIATLV